MKRFILISTLLLCFGGCAMKNAEPMSPTCQKLRRQMAAMKHRPGSPIPDEYYELKQIYEEYDCPA